MWTSRLVVFQAEDGIRDLVRSRGLGDVYKRQVMSLAIRHRWAAGVGSALPAASVAYARTSCTP